MIDQTSVEQRVAAFKQDLSVLTPLKILRRHVIHGSCAVIDDNRYFDLRCDVAEKFRVHPNEVLVVGSAKLGFSIAPSKRYRAFGDTSDIDVVLVSSRLFEQIWEEVHSYWETGGYWERSAHFKSYLFRGWIRPDKLPPAATFRLAREWWEFFNNLSSSGRYSVYKIAGALYKDWRFLESYQLRGVTSCIDQLALEGDRS